MLSDLPLAAETVALSSPRRIAFAQATMAALLGGFLIWGVGFAPVSVLHNATHDTRHANAFPCH